MLAKEEPSSPMTMGNCCVAFALLVYPVVAAQAKEFCSMSHSCVPFTPVFQPCMQSIHDADLQHTEFRWSNPWRLTIEFHSQLASGALHEVARVRSCRTQSSAHQG